MAVKTYRAKAVEIIWGVIVIDGRGEDVFVEAARTEETFTMKTGVDGETVRAQTGNTSGTITVRLMQSSASNALLSAAQLADEAGQNGIFPMLVKDGSGASTVIGGTVWLVKPPDWQRAKESQDVEWEFATDDLNLFHGGH